MYNCINSLSNLYNFFISCLNNLKIALNFSQIIIDKSKQIFMALFPQTSFIWTLQLNVFLDLDREVTVSKI